MYFIDHIKTQFISACISYVGPELTTDTVDEPIDTPESAPGSDIEWFSDLAEESWEAAEVMRDRWEELETQAEWLIWGEGKKVLTWDEWNDTITTEGTLEERKEMYSPLLTNLSEKPPFNELPQEMREEVFNKISEEWLDIPEWMTQEEAFEEAFNNYLEKEPITPKERIDHILEDEGITLDEELREKLWVYLEDIENPTLQDIEDFLQEHGETMVVEDNPSTPEDESWVPNFLAQAYSNAESYNHLPSTTWNWSWENTYTWEVFRWDAGLNKEFYDVDALRNELPTHIREKADRVAEELTRQLEAQGGKPENWIGAVYRNASNNENFTDTQPILLHNLSTGTALVHMNNRTQTVPATHGKWVGNVNGSGSTPIGSFALYWMSNGQYQARMWVRWLEAMRQNISNESEQWSYDMDPAAMWNANSDNRLIRIHEARGSRTLWCSGLPVEVARAMSQAVKSAWGGIMERFVSNPTG